MLATRDLDSLGSKLSHQSSWQESIYETYQSAQVPLDWTNELISHSKSLEIDFFTTPYDLDIVDKFAPLVPAFKIGSGDIAWDEMLERVARTEKPILFATGASTLEEVVHAYSIISGFTDKLILMQCNTNYTASIDNFKYINLNVLSIYASLFPDALLGLSDHTHGSETVLGAIALGAKVIEKHFTDDNNRQGPDHPFSMDPNSWRAMVDSSRLLESALGNPYKKVEDNEVETRVLQRRSVRLKVDVKAGELLTRDLVEYQRPCPPASIQPNDFQFFVGKKFTRDLDAETALTPSDLI